MKPLTLRELRDTLNRVLEADLDLPFAVENSVEPPFAFLGDDAGNQPPTLCVMGRMSCGPLRLREEPRDV